MEKQKNGTCPGCRRHCTADCVRCKYGRAYFAKTEGKKKNKWEKHAREGGTVWLLVKAGRSIKKALKKKKSEDLLLECLSTEEKTELKRLLEKIYAAGRA